MRGQTTWSTPQSLPGVSGLSVYVPRLRVPLEAWCEWTDTPWDKIQAVVGRSFRVAGPARERLHDGRQRGAAADPPERHRSARGRLPRARHRVEHRQRGRRRDRARAWSTARSTSSACRACRASSRCPSSSTRASAASTRSRARCATCACDGREQAGDRGQRRRRRVRARQHRRADAGRRRGRDAGRARSRSCSGSTSRTRGSASDYRGPDFRKPFARHFTEGYAPRTRRPSDFPVFSGKYSTFSYLDETVHAVEDMLEPARRLRRAVLPRACTALFFHRPYHLMPVQAMCFLYVRGLWRGAIITRKSSRACAERAGVRVRRRGARDALDARSLRRSSRATPRPSPYEATSAAAGMLRKQDAFIELLVEKMSLGSEAVKDLGNLYCAALPAWIAAGSSKRRRSGIELTGRRWSPSATAAATRPRPCRCTRCRAGGKRQRRIGFADALAGAVGSQLNPNTKPCMTDATRQTSTICRATNSRSTASGSSMTRGFRIWGGVLRVCELRRVSGPKDRGRGYEAVLLGGTD